MRATSVAAVVMLAMACGGAGTGRPAGSTSRQATPFKVSSPGEKIAEDAPQVRVGTCWASVGAGDRAVGGPGTSLLRPTGVGGAAAGRHLFSKPRRMDEPPPSGSRSRRTPGVRVGSLKTTRSLDRSKVRAALRGVQPRAVACYRAALRVAPNVRGAVYVSVTIDTAGRPVVVNASGVTVRLARCVQRAVQRLRFPRHPGPGPSHISVPLHFQLSYGTSWRPSTQAVPAAPPEACVGVVDNGPVVARRTALRECYASALAKQPGLAVRRVIHFAGGRDAVVSPDGVVSASSLDRCLTSVMAGVHLAPPPTASQVTCSLAMYPPRHRPGRVIGRRVEVTPSAVTVDGRQVADTAELRGGAVASLQGYLAGAVFGRYWRGDTVAVTLRAHPGIDVVDLDRAIHPLRERTSVHYARAVGLSDAWHIVNPAGTADFRACDRRGAGLWVEVARDGLRVGGVGPLRHIPVRRGRHDFGALGVHLRSLRRGPLRTRSDADVAGRPGVQYRAVLRALEVAYDAGLFDARLQSVGGLRRSPGKAPR